MSGMNRHGSRLAILALCLLLTGTLTAGSWLAVERGVDYREFRQNGLHAFVARIDLTREDLAIIATDEAEKGMIVSEYAERHRAIVAINADYFDEEMRPVGHAMGAAGVWTERHGTRNQPLFGIGGDRAEIFRVESRDSLLPEWVRHAVSGWPLVVENCTALTAEQLPGSDFFTRAPHPRTAVGLSKDRKTLYFVIADGRRPGVPGPTLAELGTFMQEELGVCSGLNLDGGGSTVMVVEGQIVNQPSDGSERIVANHLAVVSATERRPCPPDAPAPARDEKTTPPAE
jgi:exopolysaccharide biosynthesis protein